ncbi:hypothetical protein [Fervidibacillus albus]|uniref:hypothetical protein n=1 Tax=Fervidibacillus albus TaxID=2980026 RepID=UPI003B84AB27
MWPQGTTYRYPGTFFLLPRKAHPALLVNDLNDCRERLKRVGYEIKEDEPLEEAVRFYVDDPFWKSIGKLQRLKETVRGFSLSFFYSFSETRIFILFGLNFIPSFEIILM